MVFQVSKKDHTMRETPSENDLRCTRCNAKLNHRDEVECYDFNGRVAICCECANRPAGSFAGKVTDIERFLHRSIPIRACTSAV